MMGDRDKDKDVSTKPAKAADQHYPSGAVLGLLDGPLVTPATAAALRGRLARPTDCTEPPLLSDAQFDVLRAVAARLLPQGDRKTPIDLAGEFHRRLRTGAISDGWRYADLPPDAESFGRGFDLIAAAATARYGGDFATAAAGDQDDLLRDVQFGRVTEWRTFSSSRWFEELLAALVDIYYSHPVALDEIGYAGMADARGWQDVGIGARAPHEPEKKS